MSATQINQIKIAFQKNDKFLITEDLKIVKKSGFKWYWIVLKNNFAKFFCCKKNIWNAYKIDHVARALENFINLQQTPNVDLDNAIFIVRRLKQKVQKSGKSETYLAALNKCGDAARKITGTDVEDVPLESVKHSVNINAFAINLYNEIVKDKQMNGDKSFAISPISIVIVLGMLLKAIKNKEAYLERIGMKGLTEDQAHAYFSDMIKKICFNLGENGKIQLAQAMAIKKGAEDIVHKDLRELVSDKYKGKVFETETIMADVNKFVSENTDKNIPQILTDNNANFVLINALNLDLTWKKPFTKVDNWPVVNFECVDGRTSPVSMMSQKGDFKIYEGRGCLMLEKEYISPNGRTLSQIIYLPDYPKDILKFDSELTPELIAQHRKKAQIHCNVTLSLPKIKSESSMDLLEILCDKLKIPLNQIDNTMLGQSIDKVIHKTFIQNNEKGTKASAATAATAKCMGSAFNVKHSYAYFIMDGDHILFRGRVTDKTPLVVD